MGAQCYDCVTDCSEPPMSLQAYLDNIQKQTGVTPDQFIKLATDTAVVTS